MDVIVLPADDPKNLKIGWVIYENDGPFFLPSDDNTCYDTNKADEFIGSHGKNIENHNGTVWTVIPQLEFLNGQPWNNLALNYVKSLRPSAIRVVTKGHGITLDCYTWRVTVYLEEDNRTIRRIDQECDAGSIGASCGHDLTLKLRQQVSGEKIERFDASGVYINNNAIKRLSIEIDDEQPQTIRESVGRVIINDYTIDKINEDIK